MAFEHPTSYRHYIKRYPEETESGVETKFNQRDIEQFYDCRYVSFDGLIFDGDVQNSYSETYAEQSGDRLWLPPKDDLAFKSKECTLKLRFRGTSLIEESEGTNKLVRLTAEARARKFFNDFCGVKVEYNDTFRNKYVSLVMTKSPNIEFERLAADDSYLIVSYTFTNFLGVVYDNSKIR